MTSHRPIRRSLLLALGAMVVAACSAAPPASPPVETPAATTVAVATPPPATEPPTAAPTATPSPTALPTPTPSPTLEPTPTATAAPATSTPSPTASPTPTLAPATLAPPTGDPPELDARLERRLNRALESERSARGIPGMSAVIVFADEARWAGAAGAADIDTGRSVEPRTPFVIGSITKTFVAALFLQLQEEGRLDIDDPLANWLPDYPLATDINLRQLLNHTSGVFNYFEHPRYNSLVFGGPQETWTPDEILRRFGREGHFPPGQGFHYSNTGYILLGLVAEQVTGSDLGAELRRRFFGPLAMNDTYFQGDGPPPQSAAQGYLQRQAGYREISDDSDYRPTTSAATVAWAAGAIVSSAHDIATWARALYGGQLLQPESLAEMTDVRATPHAAGTYGLGTRTRLVSGARAYGHTGSLRGFMGVIWHMPAEDMTIAILSNLGRYDINFVADRLMGIAFGRE